MKTKNISSLIIICITLLLNVQSKAQVTVTNSLTCDIEITWESWNSGCSVCGSSNYVTVVAGQSVSVGCSAEVCITVMSVGGNNINWYNHANSTGNCHGIGSAWITAQSSTGECPGGWVASWNGPGTVWTIQ